jgi:hypothetical protein
MKYVFVVIIWIDEIPTILGSFVDEQRAIKRAQKEVTRAETIYARQPFTKVEAAMNGNWHLQNAMQDRVIVVKVEHDDTETTTPQ